MRLLLVLAPRPEQCRVFIDGDDVSRFVTGVDVCAHIDGGPTSVTLSLRPTSVEVEGEPGQLRALREAPPS